MVKYCEICGGEIKGAGRKYCSYCRNSREAREKSRFYGYSHSSYNPNEKIVYLIVFSVSFIVVVLSLLFPSSLNNETLSEVNQTNSTNISSQINTSIQETFLPEEKLINFCVSEFSDEGIFDLENTEYLEDFSSASEWVENNYENSALTEEQKETNINYIINNRLPTENYPIVATSGSEKDGQVTSQGFYYCNEGGMI